jgi:hypothetical protein
MTKKIYAKPELTTHGNVEAITLGGGSVNKDSLTGPNNNAFPNR